MRPGPHGGQALLLGEAVGYIELANDPPVDPRSDEETSLAIFFLKPDAKTSLSPTPTNVAVRVWHENKYRKVKLQASPLPKDPAGGSRFITPPGPFSLAAVRGTVTAKIDGRLVSKEVGGTR